MTRAELPSPLPLMRLTTGFWEFKAIAVAQELDLFARIDEAGPLSPEETAEALGVEARPARMLLTACAALGLLERADDGRYANAPLADAYLVPGREYSFGGWVRMLDQRLYPGWGRLADAVRENAPTTWDPATQSGGLFAVDGPGIMDTFWDAMHSLSSYTARALAGVLDLDAYRGVLDVGGGSGAYAIELCRAAPALRATVLDQPHVCPGATARIARAGLQDRVDVRPGDFLTDPALPGGHDLILLSMILHDWDEETGRALLTRCHAALPPGGAVVISELMVDDDRTGPAAAALMSLNMLVETVSGENYTARQYEEWLVGAGFEAPRRIALDAPSANQVLLATRP